ncbi:error-prone DNA polymerase [Alcaligenaceae bacterium B3P038]|nr:error-prone DNA polymerase [Alcaligenaceae bacterium B3P038]
MPSPLFSPELAGYAELTCMSNFTFLRGASHPEQLVDRARELGYTALAITDECSLGGVVRAHVEARKSAKEVDAQNRPPQVDDFPESDTGIEGDTLPGIDPRAGTESDDDASDAADAAPKAQADPEAPALHLIVGSTFTLSPPRARPARPARKRSAHAAALPAETEDGAKTDASDDTSEGDVPALTLVLLAQNREGYGNLSELITLARTRAPKGEYYLTRDDFTQPPAGYAHLAHVPDCLALLTPPYGIDAATLTAQACWLAATFPGRAALGLTLLHRSRDDLHRAAVEQAAAASGLIVAAAGQVEMHTRSRKPLHDVVAAIRLGTPVAACGYALKGNAEQHLRPRLRLASLYPPAALANTLALASRCTFSLNELKYEYPDEIVPEGMTPASFLRQETYAGAVRRFPDGLPEKVRHQIEKELDLIAQLRYEPYFLTVYDIVRFARGEGILCQGRGSAANSAVCYCLHITEVDPARTSVLFERFISIERNEPPDIDVDFEHQRREDVIQYIYKKYGRMRAALTAVVIAYRPRSVLRDTGRALGIDADVIDAAAKSHQWWDGKTELLRTFATCGLDAESPVAQQWAALAEMLMGFPRHMSQHPGGFVIARDKLSRLVPIENATMADRSVVQWDKDDLDAIGLLKVDVLALGMLSVIRRALEGVAWRRGRPFVMQDIPDDDRHTFDMICEADTVGVFQIESRAQMTMLPRLRPREFYDLVIEVAIVRPGPIQGGMVHPYLRRRQGLEDETYPSEAIREVLKRTLGVPIFQEQVMEIAMKGAGFSGGEADALRRSMAAWKRKGGVEKFRGKLIGGLISRGYSVEFAEAIFRQVEGFGEYGFPESHAASFALLAYASSWLKCHEPEAFLTALLNSQPMGFYSPSQLVQDARRHRVVVQPVDVMHSDWDATMHLGTLASNEAQSNIQGEVPYHLADHLVPATHPRPYVRLGLNLIKGLQKEAGLRIAQARREGAFTDVADMARRAGLDRAALEALAAADALRTLVGHRRQARWQAAASQPQTGLLRDAAIVDDEQPQLAAPRESQTIFDDYGSVGLTLNRHPLHLLRDELGKRRFVTAAVLRDFPSKRLSRACGLVTMRQRPQTAKGTIFVTLEDETGAINVIVRRALSERQRKELLGATLLGVYGIWQNENNVRHLIAERLIDLSMLLGDIDAPSRNFH